MSIGSAKTLLNIQKESKNQRTKIIKILDHKLITSLEPQDNLYLFLSI